MRGHKYVLQVLSVSYVHQSMVYDTLHKIDRCIGAGLCGTSGNPLSTTLGE
jgi:hypothetical protein